MANQYTLKDIAAKLGVHPVTVYRLRSGERKPSMDMMSTIRDELGWSLGTQVEALDRDRYAEKFCVFLERNYGIPY